MSYDSGTESDGVPSCSAFHVNFINEITCLGTWRTTITKVEMANLIPLQSIRNANTQKIVLTAQHIGN